MYIKILKVWFIDKYSFYLLLFAFLKPADNGSLVSLDESFTYLAGQAATSLLLVVSVWQHSK